MDCKRWQELASDYIEETLTPPAAAEAMRLHVSGCADCRADEIALRALCRELNVLPEVDPPLFFRDNVLAAIERQNERAAPNTAPWWKLLPQLSRLAMGTALATGAAAVLVWSVMLPSQQHAHESNFQANTTPLAVSASPLANLLPGANADPSPATAKTLPRLRIARVLTVDPESDGPAYDFSLWLENGANGTARFRFVGDDKRNYRFNLASGAAPQTLRVPFAAVSGKETLNLHVYWTADAASHTRYLIVPLPKDNVAAPEERQSFGLPEGNLASIAQQVSARYGIPVTLDDVPDTLRLAATARSETALQMLQRNLPADSGLRVTQSRAGLLIEKAPAVQTAEPTPASP